MDDGVDPTTNVIDKDDKIKNYIMSNFGIDIRRSGLCYYPSVIMENKQKQHYIGGKSRKAKKVSKKANKKANKTRRKRA